MTPEKQGLGCTRNDAKVAKGNLEENVSRLQACRNSPRSQGKDSSNSDELNSDNRRLRSKNSCKQGIENTYNRCGVLNCDDSLPRKSPSSPCPTSKVVRPKHASFVHTDQKNRLLVTPISVGRSIVKSFIKRNTPLKGDPKEKEKIRLKKQEQEERIQRVEEEKKYQLEGLKKKRNLRLRYVALLGNEFPKQEEEKKRKIEQKSSPIDEKNEKMREKRLAEEKAKRKVAAKRMEEAETRKTQEEEAGKHRLQQEGERQELLQQEEELERQHKMADARKLKDQRQTELELDRLHELQLTADRQWERKREQEHIEAE
ncbi:inner centromere protein-like, partial [Rhincodon typus]|uniref:inner centromere protein-like n=1 Tax=Rhincodon typus TaxID=259920 RepID=UPI00202ED810